LERNLSIDHLLERWTSSGGPEGTTSLEELCSGHTDEIQNFKDRLNAIASMMSFLGLTPEALATSKEIGNNISVNCSVTPAPGTVSSSEVGNSRSSHRSGRYQILRPLASGGLGTVFVALDTELDREVALKEIQECFVNDPKSYSRFVREAEATGRLEHPGVVPVHSFGHHADGRPYYVMRLIRGETLEDAITRLHSPPADASAGSVAETPTLRQLLRRFIDVCNVIGYAHAESTLHRDIKPANIMLGPFGETLVVDWGLARPLNDQKNVRPQSLALTEAAESDEVYSSLTQEGTAVGTPSYMSPEQAAGELGQVGQTSDIYSLGSTLYMILTGRPAFVDREVRVVLEKLKGGDFPTPRSIRPDVPTALEAICMKAMATKPADRYSSAKMLVEDLERWLADEPVEAYREPLSVRVRRKLRRHRQAVAISVAAFFFTLIGVVIITLLLSSVNRALQQASANMLARRWDKADRFGHKRPIVSREKVLDSMQDLADTSPSDVLTRRNLSATLATLGMLYRKSGRVEASLRAYNDALALREQLVAENSEVELYKSDLADTLSNLGQILATDGRKQEALKSFRRAVAIRRTISSYGQIMFYAIACDLAMSVPLLEKPEAMATADEATRTLRSAIERGFRNLEQITVDRAQALASLSDRMDFQQLMTEVGLPERAGTPKP
jgi:serine/threonine protein kinase